MPLLQVTKLALLGGLQDSKAEPQPGDLQELYNMLPLRGRFGLRAPVVETCQFKSPSYDEAVTAVDSVLAASYHNGYLYVLAWRDSVHKVYLYKLNTDGTPVSPATSPISAGGVVWPSATSAPAPVMVSMQGGDAATNVNRLYVSDYDQTQDTVWIDTSTYGNDSGLARGSNDKAVGHGAFYWSASGVTYTVAADAAGTAPGAQTVPVDKWCLYRLSISSAGTVTLTPAAANATTGYDTEALAKAALPAVPAGERDMGYVTSKTAVGQPWVAATDAFEGGSSGNPASDTNYYSALQLLVVTVCEDLNDDNTKEALKFSLIFPYQGHLWGTGFWVGGANARAEIARFSQPGLIAAVEPDVTFNTTREWWSVDWRDFGVRGQAIVGVGFAGGNAIIYKEHETHALYGYDSSSWARRTLDDRLGVAHRNAICWTEGGLCFAWSYRGPTVTDGTTLKNIGSDIRRRVLSVSAHTAMRAAYSPDDGLVYFHDTGSGLYFAYDAETARYAEGGWYNHDGTLLKAGQMVTVPTTILAGPAGAPSGLVATAVSDSEIELAWVNGDSSLGVTTEVYRDVSTPVTPSGSTLIGTATSGTIEYHDTTCAGGTKYYYTLRHVKNSQYSAACAEDDATTWLREPTSVTATDVNLGVNVAYTNNANGADIKVYRKVSGGSYSLIDTVAAVPSGAQTYNDTSCPLGNTYYYKLMASKVGYTDSEYSLEVYAYAGPYLLPVSAVTALTSSPPVGPNSVLTWTGTGLAVTDNIKLYWAINTGWGDWILVDGTVDPTALTYSEAANTVPYYIDPLLGTSLMVVYKMELYAGGSVLVQSALFGPEFWSKATHS